MSRHRANTTPNKNRPKSGPHPRKLEDRIANLQRNEAKGTNEFMEAMGITSEINRSMPLLTPEGPAGPYSNGMVLPPPFSASSGHPVNSSSPGDLKQRLNHPGLPNSGSYPTPPTTPSNNSAAQSTRSESVDRYSGAMGPSNIGRHKSDSNLIQSLLREELSPLPLHHQLPFSAHHRPHHHPPPQQHLPSIPLSQSYSSPSPSSSSHSHGKAPPGKQWMLSLPTDAFRKQRTNKMPYSPASPNMSRARKHVSTNIPPMPDFGLGYPLSPPVFNSSLKGSTSSLPDLTNADFQCGLTTPIDQEDPHMESSPAHRPRTEEEGGAGGGGPKDFDSNMPTWQPQYRPKKISTYSNPDSLVQSSLPHSSPLSPLVDKRPMRSLTVGNFAHFTDPAPSLPVAAITHDDSMLCYPPPNRSLSDLPYPPDSYDPRHSAPPLGHMTNSSDRSKRAEHYYGNPQETFSMDHAFSGSSPQQQPGSGRRAFKLSSPGPYQDNHLASEGIMFPTPPRSLGAGLGSGGSKRSPMSAGGPTGAGAGAGGVGTPYYSFTTDNLPSSSPHQPSKRPPPSYYDNYLNSSSSGGGGGGGGGLEPTSLIQERMSAWMSLAPDLLTRSWSEENLPGKMVAGGGGGGPRDKGSPLHNPFMGTMGGSGASSSSVPCLDEAAIIASLVGGGGGAGHHHHAHQHHAHQHDDFRHSSSSPPPPLSPTDSASTPTPPASARYEDDHPPFRGQICEWPMDQSRRDTLVATTGQYRSLTDLTSIFNSETGPASANGAHQKQSQAVGVSALPHQQSLPCLQNYEELLKGIDTNMTFLEPGELEFLLKEGHESISLDLQPYQTMD